MRGAHSDTVSRKKVARNGEQPAVMRAIVNALKNHTGLDGGVVLCWHGGWWHWLQGFGNVDVTCTSG